MLDYVFVEEETTLAIKRRSIKGGCSGCCLSSLEYTLQLLMLSYIYFYQLLSRRHRSLSFKRKKAIQSLHYYFFLPSGLLLLRINDDSRRRGKSSRRVGEWRARQYILELDLVRRKLLERKSMLSRVLNAVVWSQIKQIDNRDYDDGWKGFHHSSRIHCNNNNNKARINTLGGEGRLNAQG